MPPRRARGQPLHHIYALSDAQIVDLGFAAAMFFGMGRMVAAMGLTLANEREAD
jgi:hypothetical protein